MNLLPSQLPNSGLPPPLNPINISGSGPIPNPLPGIMPVALPYAAQPINVTRILELSKFPADLKTRDIQAIFSDFEEDRGGFKIKWVDDTKCLIVFQDPGTAKRALLSLLSNPPSTLSTVDPAPIIRAYTGPDVPSILTSVQNRPRSRSNASTYNSGSHSRKGSTVQGGGAGGHGRKESFGAGAGTGGSLGRAGGGKFVPGHGAGAGSSGSWGGSGGGGRMGMGGIFNEKDAPPVPPLPSGFASGGEANGNVNAERTSSPAENGIGNGNGEANAEGRTSPRRGQIGDPARRLVAGALGTKFTGNGSGSPVSQSSGAVSPVGQEDKKGTGIEDATASLSISS